MIFIFKNFCGKFCVVGKYSDLVLGCIRFNLNTGKNIGKLMNPSPRLKEGNKLIPNGKTVDSPVQN